MFYIVGILVIVVVLVYGLYKLGNCTSYNINSFSILPLENKSIHSLFDFINESDSIDLLVLNHDKHVMDFLNNVYDNNDEEHRNELQLICETLVKAKTHLNNIQYKVDEFMIENCEELMTVKQIENYAVNQIPLHENDIPILEEVLDTISNNSK